MNARRKLNSLIERSRCVLRKIFGPKREEDGSWRKLYNDKFYSLYSSPNIVRVINQGE
jgi:hypothetical protein